MKRIVFVSAFFLNAIALMAQSDPVIMTVNGVPVTRSEFEYSYNKNNSDGVIDKKSVDEYVDLFVNYKLKVAAALDAKLDTMRSFRQEFEMYRDQQVYSNVATDEEVLEQAREVYKRSEEQVGTKGLILPAHIFFRVPSDATQEEQNKIKHRADSIYGLLKAGADYADLAKRFSEDKRTGANGGDLPSWIAPNQSFKEFEDAAYALQVGEFSQPVLSPNGYHIILLKDRKPLDSFDSVKNTLIQRLEQQGIRERIVERRIMKVVQQSGGTLSRDDIIKQKVDSLSAANSDAKYLIQEYHDGLLLYEISNREVWDKGAKDEAGLAAYFKAHKKDYAWEEPRFKGMAYHVKDKADVKAVKNCVKKLPFDQWAEVLRSTFNPDSVIRIRVEKGLFKQGDNPLVDKEIFKQNTTVTPVEGYPIDAVFGKVLKKGPEDYTDVRGQVTADYQDMLEKNWATDLRRRYPVTVNKDVLKTVNKHQ